MKKLIALLMAMVMVFTVTGVVAFAEDQATETPFVTIDGVKDDTYYANRVITNDWWYYFSDNTTAYEPVDKERVKNTLYFTWDDEKMDYLYIYFVCESKDPLFKPEEGQKRGDVPSSTFYESISLYIDTAPSMPIDQAVCQTTGNACSHFHCNANNSPAKYFRCQTRYTPAWNEWWNFYRSDEGLFLTFEQFTDRREGEAGYEDLEAMYLKENGACQAVGFIDYETNTYGLEMSYPIKEGEEFFKINPTNQVQAKEWEEFGPELAYTQSATSAWWMNYNGMFEVYYEDYPPEDEVVIPPAVTAVKRMISELPEKITKDDEQTVNSLNNAYTRLNDEQKAMITEEEVAVIENAIHCIEVWRVIIAIGDIDGGKEIDATDALIVLRNAVGLQSLDEAQTVLADVNGDDTVDAADALDILKYAVKKLDRFAAAEKMEAELYAE